MHGSRTDGQARARCKSSPTGPYAHPPPTSVLLLWLAALAPAAADTKEPDRPDCKSPAYESQAKQNECANLRYRNADNELNRKYRITLKRLNEGQRRQLVLEQRAWLCQLEPPQCQEQAGQREEAGNMWPMEYADCLAMVTEARTKALGQWRVR